MTLRLHVAAATLSALFAANAWAATYYVAPNGNDAWSGKLPSPNAARTDGPFARIERAQQAARTAARDAREGVTVVLRGGRYELAKPLLFTPRDSGAAGQPMTYRAHEDERPVISGGSQITGWREHDERLWVADVPWVRQARRPFYQLFVNGARRTRARTPNAGTYFYTQRLKLTDATHPICLGFTFDRADLGPWVEQEDAQIVLFHNWVSSHNYIGKVNWPRRRITFARPAGAYFLGPSIRYYVENVFAGLDDPGEWYFDRAQGKVYYYPLPDEDMAEAEVIAPRLPATIMSIKGEPRLGLFVEHLTFRGLSFQHAGADLSRTYSHSVQGAHTQRGAVFAVGLRHAVFESCEFTHHGEHGISLREGCAHNVVRQCRFHDMGGGGVYLSEGAPRKTAEWYFTAHNTVDNNFIHDGGHIFRAGCGVLLGGSASYNRITHNEICDMSWLGMQLGWSWTGRAPAYTHHNEVAYNHIHHLGNGVLNDIGGIYTLGVSPGTVLHHNLIHDVTRFERGRQGYGGWGIYLDAGSSQIRVENNVVYNTRDGGLHLHCYGYPFDDVIVNNIFAYSDSCQIMRNGKHEPEGNYAHLERNIVLGRNAKMFDGNSWKDDSKHTSDRNLYWSEGSDAIEFKGKPLADWQAAGRDVNSLVADPQFVDPGRYDFRLRPDSPALKLGFQPIDISTAGLYGDDAWRSLPRTITHRAYEKAPPLEETGGRHIDFEDYEVAETPAGAVAKEGDAGVTISDHEPATGERCVHFVDAPGVTAWKPHWFLWRTPGAGTVRMQCHIRNDAAAPATIGLEFRQWRPANIGAGYLTGPHIQFMPDGKVMAASRGAQSRWTPVGQYRVGQWLRVEVEFEEGDGKPRTYTLRFGERGLPLATVERLPFRSATFKACTWFGLVGADTARASFYVDDFRLE